MYTHFLLIFQKKLKNYYYYFFFSNKSSSSISSKLHTLLHVKAVKVFFFPVLCSENVRSVKIIKYQNRAHPGSFPFRALATTYFSF